MFIVFTVNIMIHTSKICRGIPVIKTGKHQLVLKHLKLKNTLVKLEVRTLATAYKSRTLSEKSIIVDNPISKF